MRACEQTKGLNMLEHGQSVHAHYKLLDERLESGQHDCEILQQLWAKFGHTLPPPSVLERYHVYHDCGKHLCLHTDCDGRRHFDDHASWSAKQYAHIFPEDGFTKHLILHDMDFHVLRGDDLRNLWKSPFAPILYFTAWAEIYANAEMFGGQGSESFKIKKARLIQAGKKAKEK